MLSTRYTYFQPEYISLQCFITYIPADAVWTWNCEHKSLIRCVICCPKIINGWRGASVASLKRSYGLMSFAQFVYLYELDFRYSDSLFSIRNMYKWWHTHGSETWCFTIGLINTLLVALRAILEISLRDSRRN